MKEKAAYLKGLIDGLGIDETTKEGKVIKAMSELLGELAEAVDAIDEDVTHAYDQINDLSEELEDLEADLYEDDDTDDDDEEPEEDAEDAEDSGDDDDNADVAGEPYYEVACPACGNTVYVSEDDLDAGVYSSVTSKSSGLPQAGQTGSPSSRASSSTTEVAPQAGQVTEE